jgi:hypothetical protein
MTEAKWLACAHPYQMLEFLRGRASERRLRLLLTACCRGFQPLLTDFRAAQAATTAERDTAGLATKKELRMAREGILSLLQDKLGWRNEDIDFHLESAEWWPHFEDSQKVNATLAVAIASWYVMADTLSHQEAEREVSRLAAAAPERQDGNQCALLRDLFNPFRPVICGQSWRTPTVLGFAQSVYDQSAFDRLPILADALEDAGCTDAAILEHCRGPGPHVRGCWVVDLLLGKQ